MRATSFALALLVPLLVLGLPIHQFDRDSGRIEDLETGCAAGEIAKSDGAGGLDCAADATGGGGGGHGDGANCPAGEIPLGVDPNGAVQGCYEPAFGDITGTAADGQIPSSVTRDALWNAHSVVMAVSDDTPAALTVGTNTIVGRAAGNIVALTPTETRTILNVEDNADVTDEANVIAALGGASVPAATVATGDKVLIQDIDDSSELKSVTAQSIADLDGPVTLDDLSTDVEFILQHFNGTIQQGFNATVAASDPNAAIMSLVRKDGGDLTIRFSDGFQLIDTTPAKTMELTRGSDSAPQSNWVYILQTDPNTLVKSTSAWPDNTIEHAKIGYFLVPSGTFIQDHGVYVNQNWNDFRAVNGQGHLSHITENARVAGAEWFSGIDGNGTDGYLTPAAGATDFKSTAGTVYQLHQHPVEAIDTSDASDTVLVKNWSGDPYHHLDDPNVGLFAITADSTGGNIANNKYFNLIFWGVANRGNDFHPLVVNLPGGSYNSLISARGDVSNFDDGVIPREFNNDSSTGFLIARVTIRMGATWTVDTTIDLRGVDARSVTGGVSSSVSSFSDNIFEIFDESDITKILDFSVGGNSTGVTGTFLTAFTTIKTVTFQDVAGTVLVTGGIDVPVADGGTGASTLNDLITLAAHTTGDFVGTITAGDGLASTGSTTGEDIDHTLSVDLLGTDDPNSAVTSSASGLEFNSSKLALIQGCSAGQILKRDGSGWACNTDDDAGTGLSAGNMILVTTSGVDDNECGSFSSACASVGQAIANIDDVSSSNDYLISIAAGDYTEPRRCTNDFDTICTVDSDCVFGTPCAGGECNTGTNVGCNADADCTGGVCARQVRFGAQCSDGTNDGTPCRMKCNNYPTISCSVDAECLNIAVCSNDPNQACHRDLQCGGGSDTCDVVARDTCVAQTDLCTDGGTCKQRSWMLVEGVDRARTLLTLNALHDTMCDIDLSRSQNIVFKDASMFTGNSLGGFCSTGVATGMRTVDFDIITVGDSERPDRGVQIHIAGAGNLIWQVHNPSFFNSDGDTDAAMLYYEISESFGVPHVAALAGNDQRFRQNTNGGTGCNAGTCSVDPNTVCDAADDCTSGTCEKMGCGSVDILWIDGFIQSQNGLLIQNRPGYCTDDVTVNCHIDGDCADFGPGGTCNTSTLVGLAFNEQFESMEQFQVADDKNDVICQTQCVYPSECVADRTQAKAFQGSACTVAANACEDDPNTPCTVDGDCGTYCEHATCVTGYGAGRCSNDKSLTCTPPSDPNSVCSGSCLSSSCIAADSPVTAFININCRGQTETGCLIQPNFFSMEMKAVIGLPPEKSIILEDGASLKTWASIWPREDESIEPNSTSAIIPFFATSSVHKTVQYDPLQDPNLDALRFNGQHGYNSVIERFQYATADDPNAPAVRTIPSSSSEDAETGTGGFVLAGTPTITTPELLTPTIVSFSSATHSHADAAGGGTITHTTEVNNLETADPPNVANDEVYVGTGPGAGTWIGLQTCGAGSHQDFNGSAFVCEADDVGVDFDGSSPTLAKADGMRANLDGVGITLLDDDGGAIAAFPEAGNTVIGPTSGASDTVNIHAQGDFNLEYDASGGGASFNVKENGTTRVSFDNGGDVDFRQEIQGRKDIGTDLCVRIGNRATDASASCICRDAGGRLYGDVNCDGSKSGEEFLDVTDTNTNADTICSGTGNYLDGEGNCDPLVTDTNSWKEACFDAATLQPINAAFPALDLEIGSNARHFQMLFDADTGECLQGKFVVPRDAAAGSNTIEFYVAWKSGTKNDPNSANDDVYWRFQERQHSNDDAWDTLKSNHDIFTAATRAASADQMSIDIVAGPSLTTLGWSANDLVEFAICRAAAAGSDNMPGNAELMEFCVRIPRE